MHNYIKPLIALFVAFAISIPSAGQTLHKYISIDRFNNEGIVDQPQEIVVPGKLVLPIGAGPFPAVVIPNSSSGEGDLIAQKLLMDLPARGYAAFSIQSFTARGHVGGVGRNQRAITFQGPAADALYALEFLRTVKDIDPNRICVAGHSRGAQSAFNFNYFTYFHELAGFKGKPFDCNISINTTGFYRPKVETTTGKPALILMGDKDDGWHLDVAMSWYQDMIKRGENIKLVTIKDSHHSLTSQAGYCPASQTPKGCREHVVYSGEGASVGGKILDRLSIGKMCNQNGYTCGYGSMDRYPEALEHIVEFLNQSIGKKSD